MLGNFPKSLIGTRNRLYENSMLLSRPPNKNPQTHPGASPPTDGGGVEPNKIGPNPNSSSCLISYPGEWLSPPLSYFISYHRMCERCAHHVHLFSDGGRAQYEGLSWQGSLCFWESKSGGAQTAGGLAILNYFHSNLNSTGGAHCFGRTDFTSISTRPSIV